MERFINAKKKDFFRAKINFLVTKTQKELTEKYVENKQLDIVKEVIKTSERRLNRVVVVTAMLMSFLPLVLPKENTNIIFKICPYIIFVLFVCGYEYYIFKLKIWYTVNDNMMNKKFKKVSEANINVDELKADIDKKRTQLIKTRTLLSIICKKVSENYNIKELTEVVALDILSSLDGNGKYSIAIYESYLDKFWMPCFQTNVEGYNSPKLYEKGVTEVRNNSFKKYCSYKCLHGKESMSVMLLKTKEDVKNNLFSASEEYSQYACYSLKLSKNHKILLEFVAYGDDTFSSEDSFDHYFRNLFELYIPILQVVFSISDSEQLNRVNKK